MQKTNYGMQKSDENVEMHKLTRFDCSFQYPSPTIHGCLARFQKPTPITSTKNKMKNDKNWTHEWL